MSDGTTQDYSSSTAIDGMQQLSDFAEISEVLHARRSFVQGAYAAGADEVMRDTVTMLDGDEHLRRRRLLSRLTSDEAVQRYRREALHPMIDRTLNEVARDDRGAAGVVHTDLVTVTQRCLYRIASVSAGIDSPEEPEAIDRFIGYVRTIARGVSADWSVDDPGAAVAAAEEALESYRVEFFEPSQRRRQELLDSGGQAPNDLLALMCAHHWHDGSDADLPLRESGVFMVAATQNTAASLILLILRLHDWFASHPHDRRELETDPDFLRRATQDSLRMMVGSPARIRRAVEDVRLSSGRRIRSGERVALLFSPANVEPGRFGPDAESFNPHRSVEGTVPWGLTFGAGTHVCPGRPMVTGHRGAGVDGTITAVARRLYAAGLELDGPPIPDPTTHYAVYTSVPVVLHAL